MIFLSSLISSSSPSQTSLPSSSSTIQSPTTTTSSSSNCYLLIGQNDVVIGKFELTGDEDEDEKSVKMLVDALPGGLSIIGILHNPPAECGATKSHKKLGKLKDVVLTPDVKTFESVAEKFVILRLTCPKLLVDQSTISVPDTFIFSNSLGVGSAANDLVSNKKSLAAAPPVVTVRPLHDVMDGFALPVSDGSDDNSQVATFSLNVVCYMLRSPDLNLGHAAALIHSTLKEKIARGLGQMKDLSAELCGIAPGRSFTVSSFPMAALCVTACFPRSEYALGTKTCTEFRRRVQSGFSHSSGPLMHPLYSLELAWGGAERSNNKRKGAVPLRNVHEQVADVTASSTHGTLHFVKGGYDYYHYMQGGLNDSGWGCAYRSMQTLCSWLSCGGYTQKQVPRHREIQATLAELGDKPASFVGSHDWIGAIEISLCLQRMYGVESRILNVQSGSDLVNFAGEIASHFDENGSPIMVGGGVLAYTIIGIDWNRETGEVEFLILDPHYTGLDDPQTIKAGGWCAWKKPSLFKKEHFYNLCMPIKPNII